MMKKNHSKISVNKLCQLFGKTRHAYYDRSWHKEQITLESAIVLDLVAEQREQMPCIGTPKLYHLIKQPLLKHGIKMGRDKLNNLLSEYDLLIRKKRRRAQTTNSRHWFRRYPNLVREIEVMRPEEVWVSDITYLNVGDGFGYLSLITDAYSKKIMGYCLYPTLEHIGCLNALKMALSNRIYNQNLIHHSDRGLQYCCYEYTGLLGEHGVEISMTEKKDPYENAVAERMNGILKTDFQLDRIFPGFQEAQQSIDQAIATYNEKWPHGSCDYLPPDEAHKQKGKLTKKWKTYYKPKALE